MRRIVGVAAVLALLTGGLVVSPRSAVVRDVINPEADIDLACGYVKEAIWCGQTAVAEVSAWNALRSLDGHPEHILSVAADLIATEDEDTVRSHHCGVRQGKIPGVSPSGRAVTMSGICIVRSAGSQTAAGSTLVDILGPVRGLEGSPVPGSTPAATPAVTPATGLDQPITDEAGLIAALRTYGVTIEDAGTVEQPFLQVPGTVLLVSGGELTMPAELHVFAYPDATTAEADAEQIGPDGQPSMMMVTWIAPPHFFRQGTLLVLYLGEDPAALDLLTELLGPQFAGA